MVRRERAAHGRDGEQDEPITSTDFGGAVAEDGAPARSKEDGRAVSPWHPRLERCGVGAARNQLSGGGAVTDEVFVHPTSLVDTGARIGAGTKIWHFCHVLGGAMIGARCTIGQNVMIGGRVVVGDRVKIQNNVSIYDGVIIEDDVFCGPSMVFTNVLTPRAFVERKAEFAPTRVRRGATIGANATVVCGVTIGEYAMIGAGAVVTRDIADHALVVGAPARRIGWVSRSGDRLTDVLVCPRTGETYRESQTGLVLCDGSGG